MKKVVFLLSILACVQLVSCSKNEVYMPEFGLVQPNTDAHYNLGDTIHGIVDVHSRNNGIESIDVTIVCSSCTTSMFSQKMYPSLNSPNAMIYTFEYVVTSADKIHPMVSATIFTRDKQMMSMAVPIHFN
jgi:hypothetical protein